MQSTRSSKLIPRTFRSNTVAESLSQRQAQRLEHLLEYEQKI
jgi:hypothetical protein